jgi:type VI secretion system protein ImpM
MVTPPLPPQPGVDDVDGSMGCAPSPVGPLLRPIVTGWWGKLPTQGDFVGEGLPVAWRTVWDEWLQRALAHALRRLGRDELRTRLLAMPPWQCLVPAPADAARDNGGRGDGTSWTGVVLAASDRVGRVFPMLLAEGYAADALAMAGVPALQRRALRLADWLDQVGVLAGPAEFAAGAQALTSDAWAPAAPPSAGDATAPESATLTVGALCAAHPQVGSFWWRPEPVGVMPPPRLEPWPPAEALLLEWLGSPDDASPTADEAPPD